MKDGNYRFILHYMEYLTKFSQICPLKTKTAEEVAKELVYIFLDTGAPHILQFVNSREFTAEVIRELSTLWPRYVLVNGCPRHPQSQGSVERGNGSMKLKLLNWMQDNTASWSVGIHFMQWSMNNTYHEATYMEPYKALTENKPRCGLAIKLPANFLAHITTGVTEELIQLMNITTEDVQDAGVPPDELTMPQCNTPSHKMFLPLQMSLCQIYQQQQISWSRKMLLPQKFLLQMMMLPQKRFIPWMFQIQKILPPLKMHQLLRYPSLKNPPLLQLTLQRRPPTIEATNTEEAINSLNAEVHAKDTDVIEHPAKHASWKQNPA